MALTSHGLEVAAGAAHDAVHNYVRIYDSGDTTVLGQLDISAIADDEQASGGDGVVSTSALITITASASGTAVTVRWYDGDPAVAGVETANDLATAVMNTTNVVSGEDITIAIGALSTTATNA